MNMKKLLVNDGPAISFLEENLQKEISLLNELKEYGIALFLRILGTVEKNKDKFIIKDFVVFHIIYKNFLSMVDGITILIPKGSTLSSFPAVRSLFETSLYIDWIIQENPILRAKCFYVWNLRHRISKVKNVIEGTKEHETFRTFLISKLGEETLIKYDQVKAIKAVEDLEKQLNSGEYKKINERFSKIKAEHPHNLEPNWFKPANGGSIWSIARSVSRTDEYNFIYRELCNISHVNSMDYHIKEIPNQIVIEPIRQPQLAPEIISTSLQLCFHTYRTIILEYRKEELEAFKRKYIEEWQQVFLNIQPIITQTNHIPITDILDY